MILFFKGRSVVRALAFAVFAFTTTTIAAHAQISAASKEDSGADTSRGKADVFRLVQDVPEGMTLEGLKTFLGYDLMMDTGAPTAVNKSDVMVGYEVKAPYVRSAVSPSLTYSETIDRTSHVRTGFSISGSFARPSRGDSSCMRVRDLDDAARFSGWTSAGASSTFVSHQIRYKKGHLNLVIFAEGGPGEGRSAVSSPSADSDDSCVEIFVLGAATAG